MTSWCCGHTFSCIAIAVWTIVQTGFHLYGLVYINWWRQCTADVQNDDHSLYFLTARAGSMNVLLQGGLNITIAGELLDSAVLDTLITVYMVLDAAWIVASVALLMGATCRIKECWALVFYTPWIVVNVLVSLYDAFCAIFFGLHIPKTGTFADWLRFIGIDINFSETNDLHGEMSSLVTGAASVLMLFISARGGIIWILNLLLIIFVVRAARAAYREKFTDETSHDRRRREKNPAEIRPYTASARIRNWHQFYGPMETSVSEEGGGASAEEGDDGSRGGRPQNAESTNDFVRSQNFVYRRGADELHELDEVRAYPVSNDEDLPSTSRARSGVSRSMLDEIARRPYLGELRSQLPWTYVQEEQEDPAKLAPNDGGLSEKDPRNHETASKF